MDTEIKRLNEIEMAYLQVVILVILQCQILPYVAGWGKISIGGRAECKDTGPYDIGWTRWFEFAFFVKPRMLRIKIVTYPQYKKNFWGKIWWRHTKSYFVKTKVRGFYQGNPIGTRFLFWITADDRGSKLYHKETYYVHEMNYSYPERVNSRCYFAGRVEFECARDYYNSPDCNVYCIPSSTVQYCHKTTGKAICKPGYYGENTCNKMIDVCARARNFCRVGSTCKNIDGVHIKCICPSGYKGIQCDKDINECQNSPTPCENGGICTNTYGSFTCKCPPKFLGKTCNILNKCVANPTICKNGGTCTMEGDKYKCRCTKFFHGEHCSVDINECKNSKPPCENGGTCTNTHGYFTCKCQKQFFGKTCTNRNQCVLQKNICKNGGTCYAFGSNFGCHCTDSYEGKDCSKDVNECDKYPQICKNGGTCQNNHGDFTCICTPDFHGKICNGTWNNDLLS